MRLFSIGLWVALVMISPSFAQSPAPGEPQTYEHGEESKPMAGVPEGKVSKHCCGAKLTPMSIELVHVEIKLPETLRN